MISSLNWELLLGGSELTEPFLPPFVLSLLSPSAALRSFLLSSNAVGHVAIEWDL